MSVPRSLVSMFRRGPLTGLYRLAVTQSSACRFSSPRAMPGRESAPPSPNPDAPDALHSASLSGVMPPVTITGTPEGKTVFNAFKIWGDEASAGKYFSAVAPAACAANASDGVRKPGTDARPAATVAVMTAASVFGDTMSRPPAAATSVTWLHDNTVPAPTTARSPTAPARISMLRSGSGEFSGTSIKVNPESTSTSPAAAASSGRIPRRMATSGHCSSAEAKSITTLSRFG